MQPFLENIAINSDQTIIEKVLAGDNTLFEILIRRHNPVLYKIARGYGFNHQDAEDIMQDVHVTAFTNLPKFENRARVLLQQKIEQVYTHQDIYSFNLVYCDAIVHQVFTRINILTNHDEPGNS